ncbi:hypothetical protein SAMN02745945_02863 [Peptoclostridium litorale DSM 5388]|uniref:Uncharacterized protein n=1 Tax=Peptoclostridium litorale DSM 5388 TaxID=1121324 RepID=A0A069RIC2_PEPLI|nr:hypothetical protein [Peptoclostridium litorale]KDR96756.1 hypothetical protein CLIT_2c03620 [Peptoclostridium litorale DSM 5388]SIO34772.1 hypothetical protein SAMN02745945_02863 [Peptoclostridium litorale DSM 5388]
MKREKLFADLAQYYIEDAPPDKHLIDDGYLDEDYNKTKKAEKFIEEFYNEKKDLILSAIGGQGSYLENPAHVMTSSGLKTESAFNAMLHLLHSKGELKCTKNKENEPVDYCV